MLPYRLSLLVGFCLAGLLCVSCDSNQVRQEIEKTFHLPRSPYAVEAKKYSQFQAAPGVVADRVSYATAYNLRIPAIVYHPQTSPTKAMPALIIVNGHGGDKSSWYAYWAGILYARAGAVVLTYDPIGEFERNHLRESGTNQHDTLLEPEDMARRMAGLMVQDVRQGVSYLRSRKDVDRGRIAILGYSMGSFISSLACAVETRAKACVLVGGGDLDGPGGYWDSSGKTMCQATPYRSLAFLQDRGAVLYALSPETLVWNGSDDTVVDIPHHGPAFFEDLKARSKAPMTYGFTADGGHRPYFLTKPVAEWLTVHLKLPNWTEAQVAAMPETHISEWAAQHRLRSSGFRNEKHEGGTQAIGGDIEPVSHDSLHAVPDSVWQSDEPRYLYETWVEHARVAIRSGTP